MKSKSSVYKNEVEKPSMPMEGHLDRTMGAEDMMGDADPIAYGASGEAGCKSDARKIKSQFKNYGWS